MGATARDNRLFADAVLYRLTTKIHTTVDALGSLTGFHLTPGQAHELDDADILLKATPAGAVLADKAYDAQARVIDPLLAAGKTVMIPLRSARSVQPST